MPSAPRATAPVCMILRSTWMVLLLSRNLERPQSTRRNVANEEHAKNKTPVALVQIVTKL
jgi:hypothetical protein